MEKDLSEIIKEFHNLKKGKISVNEYHMAFSKKMKLVPYLIPIEHSKIKTFVNGLPIDFGPMVKLATSLEVAV